jgi:hypothetical protein
MSHSKMLTTRRRKARHLKLLSGVAKREKKARNQTTKTAPAGAAAKE